MPIAADARIRVLLASAIIIAAVVQARPVLAAERRVALVIGNSAYPSSRLRNPVNDAKAMAEKLRGLGFEVILRTDSNLREMTRSFSQFGQKLTPGSVSLFYYAGHGVQVQGKNFLIPVDAEIESEAAVRTEAVDVDQLLHQLGPARLSMVILDACRNNPFERRFRGAASGGLAQIDAPTGTLLAYATAPGKVAADGAGVNGLYTTELLKAIDTPGLKIEDVFKQVRINVLKSSDNLQIPWESSSLTGEFFFRPGTRAEVENAQLRQSERERAEMLKEMEKLRAEMLELKGIGAQVALASPTTTTSAATTATTAETSLYKAEWTQRIALLEQLRGQLTFAKALALLLDVSADGDLSLLLSHELNIKRYNWHNAYALGTDSTGSFIWGGGYQFRTLAFATETAIEKCASRPGDSCKVVIDNGEFRKNDLIEVAKRLGGKNVATVRQALLQSLMREPTEFIVGLAGNNNVGGGRSMGFSSVRE